MSLIIIIFLVYKLFYSAFVEMKNYEMIMRLFIQITYCIQYSKITKKILQLFLSFIEDTEVTYKTF